MFTDILHSLPTVEKWGVAWTKPRAEKAVLADLSLRNIACYLPTFERKHVRAKKRDVRTYNIPLFPGYVFLDTGAWFSQVRQYSRHVVDVLEAPDPGQLKSELANLSFALSKSAVAQTMRFGGVGRSVRVTQGPLKGLTGILTEINGNSRLVIKVSLLSVGALLTIDDSMVEPL